MCILRLTHVKKLQQPRVARCNIKVLDINSAMVTKQKKLILRCFYHSNRKKYITKDIYFPVLHMYIKFQ